MKSIKISSFTKKASKFGDFVLIFSRLNEILRNYFRMSYNLNGRKILIVINVRKYVKIEDREGSENDYELVLKTFKGRVASNFPQL